ncbi:MAG: DUF2723 domain-containing protein [Phycisphaerales bacterium]|nr:DUF2723 domain-containing protein [Phycisphaerales bacterium]MCB9864321.1 DUF2723 domain-containing protein [Phycisphaerales bacterium]
MRDKFHFRKRQSNPSAMPWRSHVLGLWPGLIALVVFVFTLAPTVTGEDAGELITAAYYFGVPHPPGYPLWTILCGIWVNLFPIGNVAWRANLFSAICMAACVQVMAGALMRMGFRRWPAGLAATLMGLGATVWSQSVIAEVYTLNLLIVSIMVWLTVRWLKERTDRWLIICALVFGLGMSNHHTIGFAALGLVFWAIWMVPTLIYRFDLAVRCTIALCFGLLPYGYMLFAARRHTPVNWGETTTLAAVWEHVSRGQYKSDSPIEVVRKESLAQEASEQFYMARWMVRDTTPFGMAVVVLGMAWLWRRRGYRKWMWLAVTSALCTGPVFLFATWIEPSRQSEFVCKVFLTPLALALAIPMAAGLSWISAASGMLSRRGSKRPRSVVRSRLASVIATMVALAVPIVTHGRENNMRHYWYAYDHAQSMLDCMLPNALVFPSGDHNTFPLIYLVHVDGIRPDVRIADKYGYIELDLYRDMPNNPGKPRTREQREAIESWIIGTSKRPVYFTTKKPSPLPDATVVLSGVVYHLLPKGYEYDGDEAWRRIRYRNVDGMPAPIDHAAMNIVADYYHARGIRATEAGDIESAKAEFDRVLEYGWGMREIHNNVASALAEADCLDRAIGIYEDAAKMDWTYAPARWNLARIFKSLGKYDWAASVFEDLTRATPGDFRPFGELGFLMKERLGRPMEAVYWWYESLRIQPDQPQIIAALAAQLSENQAKLTNPEQAGSHMDDAIVEGTQ